MDQIHIKKNGQYEKNIFKISESQPSSPNAETKVCLPGSGLLAFVSSQCCGRTLGEDRGPQDDSVPVSCAKELAVRVHQHLFSKSVFLKTKCGTILLGEFKKQFEGQ